MHASVGPALYGVLSYFEGVRQSMYLDQARPPRVTVGIGFLIDPYARAFATGLGNWGRRGGGGAVTETEFREEWNQVKRGTPGYQRQFLLNPTAMQPLFNRQATANDGILAGMFPGPRGYSTFPADAQLGILCVSWLKSSAEGLRSGFPNFVAACAARDWRRAGPESLWQAIRDATPGPGGDRRVQRRFAMLRLFDNAAAVEEANRQRADAIPWGRLFYPNMAPAPRGSSEAPIVRPR